jgi:hypothetical protein
MSVYGDVQIQGLEWMRHPFEFFFCQHKLRELFRYSCDPSTASQSWTNELCNFCFDTSTGAVGNVVDVPLSNFDLQENIELFYSLSKYIEYLQGKQQHPKKPVVDANASMYVCRTQGPGKVRSNGLCVNTDLNNPSIFRRWTPGSTLTYFLVTTFLPSGSIAVIQSAMETAVADWRGTGVNINLEETQARQDATFVVVYDKDLDAKTYAEAFFPGDRERILRIGRRMFQPRYIKHTSNVLCHELGHVLGLRHVFWQKLEEESNVRNFPTDDLDELSIMNNERVRDLSLLVLSDLDRKHIRDLYNLQAGPQKDFIIEDYLPKPLPMTRKEAKYWVRRSVQWWSQ